MFSRPPEDQNNSRNEASSSDTPEINHSFVLSPSEERELQKSLTQALGSVHIVIDGHLMTLNVSRAFCDFYKWSLLIIFFMTV